MRVFGLLSLVIGVVIVAFFAVDRFETLGGSSGSPKQSVNEAETIAAKANLNAIAQRLNLFYAENGRYPNTLDELESFNQDVSIFNYQLCDTDKAVIKLGSITMLLTGGNAVLDGSGGC